MLSKEDFKELQELNVKCGAALSCIEDGIMKKHFWEVYCTSFARMGDILFSVISKNNARAIGDLVVDENGNCSPLNTKS